MKAVFWMIGLIAVGLYADTVVAHFVGGFINTQLDLVQRALEDRR